MGTGNSMFYGALLLTGANLLLRLAGMGFQVYLSGQIGPAGIGLLHLVFSVRALAFTLGLGGVRTAALYLTAGRKGVRSILRGCFQYSLACSLTAAAGLWLLAPKLSAGWNGDGLEALRACAAFLPVSCLCGVLSGHFTAAGRIRTLVAVEFLEQGCAIAATVFLLAGGVEGVLSVVLGGSLAAAAAFCALLRLCRLPPEPDAGTPYRRILCMALPLGVSESLRAGLNTVENLIVPQRLALYAGTVSAIADYGVICGMVFPILMFPTAILFSLAELLVPELSRCVPGGPRPPYLAKRGLRVSLLFGLWASGFLFAAAGPLGEILYHSEAVGASLRLYAPLVPVLYMDAIVDAMCKGLGQQSANARYNLITSLLDVVILWVFLPRCGLGGYYFSFAVTHLLNFALSLRRLVRTANASLSPGIALRAAGAAAAVSWISGMLPTWKTPLGGAAFAGYYTLLLSCFWTALHVVDREDLMWLLRLAGKPPVRTRARSAGRAGRSK